MKFGVHTLSLTLVQLFLSCALIFPIRGAEPSTELAPKYPTTEFRMCFELYQRLLLNIVKVATVTSNRRERRVQVNDMAADSFIENVRMLLGDGNVPTEREKRLKLRDIPPERSSFITNTDYLPAFKVYNNNNERLLKGVIRIRNYIEVPDWTETLGIESLAKEQLKFVKLADGNGVYAKLEFKVGHPESDANDELRDVKGVVDKPGVTLLRSDIDLLLASKTSYRTNKEAVLKRAQEITQTKRVKTENGQYKLEPKPVNERMDEVTEMINRIGLMHDQNFGKDALKPEINMRYQRTAYTVGFKHPASHRALFDREDFEVQITVDKDIRVRGVKEGEIWRYPLQDRVIELKIPLVYANLPDQTLRNMGLGELADIRERFLKLEGIRNEGTTLDAGKNPNIKERGQYLGRFKSLLFEDEP